MRVTSSPAPSHSLARSLVRLSLVGRFSVQTAECRNGAKYHRSSVTFPLPFALTALSLSALHRSISIIWTVNSSLCAHLRNVSFVCKTAAVGLSQAALCAQLLGVFQNTIVYLLVWEMILVRRAEIHA